MHMGSHAFHKHSIGQGGRGAAGCPERTHNAVSAVVPAAGLLHLQEGCWPFWALLWSHRVIPAMVLPCFNPARALCAAHKARLAFSTLLKFPCHSCPRPRPHPPTRPPGKTKGPPPAVKKVLSLFGSGREEDRMTGYLSFLKIGPQLLKFIPGGCCGAGHGGLWVRRNAMCACC